MSIKIEVNLTDSLNRFYRIMLGLFNKFGIGHVLLLSLGLHLFAMCFPSDGGMVFDEVHYVKATRAHMQGIGANSEHTMLVKVFMSFIFQFFGDFWFAWRLPIVISAMITFLAFYYIAKHFIGERYAVLATLFLNFDTLFFIHGTIYLLDMPAIMFGLGGIALYLCKKYKFSALSMVLAILCKEIAAFFLIGLLLYGVSTNLGRIKLFFTGKRTRKKKAERDWSTIGTPFTYLSIVVLVGFLIVTAYDNVYEVPSSVVVHNNIINNVVQDQNGNPITTEVRTEIYTKTKLVTNPVEHVQLFWKYHTEWMTNLEAPYRSYQKPWNWIAPFDLLGALDHPVYFQVKVTVGDRSYDTISWKAQGTLPIWYSFWMIIPMSVFQLMKRKEIKLNVLILSWIISTYFSFVILEVFKKSTGFNYYFIYTIPTLCLGIASFWKSVEVDNKIRFLGIIIHLLLTLSFFFVYFPVGVFR